MSLNPYQATPTSEEPAGTQRSPLAIATLIVAIALLSGGIGAVAGTAVSRGDWFLGVAAVSILLGQGLAAFVGPRVGRR
ncbi:MAG: hypothetical protein JNG90_06220 [Planctomycetaceae bacterium]|nr:hypothetical protein [Planctomycetaceae bacterium]